MQRLITPLPLVGVPQLPATATLRNRAYASVQRARAASETIRTMPCLLVLLLLAFPRIALVVMFLTSNYLQRAYHGLLIPVLGFFFLPLTTIVYAWLTNTHAPLEGVNLIYLIVAVLIDAGGLGGGEAHRRSRA